MKKLAGSNFRSWLVEQLALSRFAVYRDDTDQAIARRIGVTVDVLQEARELAERRERRLDEKGRKLGMPRAKTLSRFHVWLEPPREVHLDWVAQCKSRDQTTACLFRSVVHHVLRLKWQPDWLTATKPAAWYYKGRWLAQTDIRKHQYRMHTYLTGTCSRALTARALATGTTASAIARWGVTSFLEGHFRNFTIVTSLESLYNDADRYQIKPTILKETMHA